MNDQSAQTLFKLLATRPALLNEQANTLFLRARLLPDLLQFDRSRITCLQTFKPLAAELSAASFTTTVDLDQSYEQAFYLATSQRAENLFNFARLAEMLKPSGNIFVSMSNELGAKRFEKNLAQLLGNIESFSKNHCRVFWGQVNDQLDTDLLKSWKELGQAKIITGTNLSSQAGIFCHGKIDRGSEILTTCLPKDLAGQGADLGAGYGFLSQYVLRTCPAITSLTLYEAELLALNMAKLNVTSTTCQIQYQWHDILKGLPQNNLDWIIMNPPFHAGKQKQFHLGEKFIEVAARALKPNGQLYMVANQHLPYLDILKNSFSKATLLTIQTGFKVYQATK